MDANPDARSTPLSDPQALAAFQRGVERAVRGYLAGLKTEPLSIAAWAEEFDVGRETARMFVPKINGAERFGRKWRIPLSAAPPHYWATRGLFRRG